MSRYSLGIDIGGTFTDIVVYDHERAQSVSHKELTTPDAPARRRHDRHTAGSSKRTRMAYADVVRVVHATTLVHQRADRAQGRAAPASSRPKGSATRSR